MLMVIRSMATCTSIPVDGLIVKSAEESQLTGIGKRTQSG